MTKYTERLQELIDNGAFPGTIGTLTVKAPTCPNCNDRGFVTVFVPRSGPWDSCPGSGIYLESTDSRRKGWYIGSSEYDHCPVCSTGRVKEYLESVCGLRNPDLTISISDFQTVGPLAAKKPAKDRVASYLAMGRSPRGMLTLWGQYGAGKTMLLKAMVNGFRYMGLYARYTTMADLLSEIRERFGDDIRAVENVIQSYRQIRVLAVDELDRVNLTSWAKETTYRLLGSRYDEMDELLTAYALNPKPEYMDAEWGYLVSRMYQGDVVEVPGPDAREMLHSVAEALAA